MQLTPKQKRWWDITSLIIFSVTSLVLFSEYFNYNGGAFDLVAAILFGFMAIVKMGLLIIDRRERKMK